VYGNLAAFHVLINEKEWLELLLPAEGANFASGMCIAVMAIEGCLPGKDLLAEEALTKSLLSHKQSITPLGQLPPFNNHQLFLICCQFIWSTRHQRPKQINRIWDLFPSPIAERHQIDFAPWKLPLSQNHVQIRIWLHHALLQLVEETCGAAFDWRFALFGAEFVRDSCEILTVFFQEFYESVLFGGRPGIGKFWL